MEDKKKKIFDAARKLFLEKGFKKTNIAGIAKEANIAVGSVYRFYESKEAIFVQVYNYENEMVKHDILKKLDFDEEPHELLHQVVQSIFDHSSNNKILQVWFDESKINALIAEQVNLSDSFVYATFSKLIDHWISKRLVKDGLTKDRIMNFFNLIAVVDIHQNEIQTDNYFQTLSDLIDSFLLFILK